MTDSWRDVEIFNRQFPNDEVVRVAATRFFEELLTTFNFAASQYTGEEDSEPQGYRKFTLSVGHTENIAKIVLALNLDPAKYHLHPLYASQFIFELHHKANKEVT
jgi:hypothetical protein